MEIEREITIEQPPEYDYFSKFLGAIASISLVDVHSHDLQKSRVAFHFDFHSLFRQDTRITHALYQRHIMATLHTLLFHPSYQYIFLNRSQMKALSYR